MDNAMKNILDAAREYGFFQNRADIPADDWTVANFPVAGTWYDLDLTSIVPANAHAALFRCSLRASSAAKYFALRQKGYTQSPIAAYIDVSVAWMYDRNDMIVGIGPDRTVQGRKSHADINAITLNVKGWWF